MWYIRNLANLKSNIKFSFIFSFKSFIVLHISICSILNYLLYTWVVETKFHCHKYWSCTICLKDYPFSTELPLPLCRNLINLMNLDLFLDSLFCSTDLFDYADADTILSTLQLFIRRLQIRSYKSLTLLFFYKVTLTPRSFAFQYDC